MGRSIGGRNSPCILGLGPPALFSQGNLVLPGYAVGCDWASTVIPEELS